MIPDATGQDTPVVPGPRLSGGDARAAALAPLPLLPQDAMFLVGCRVPQNGGPSDEAP